MSTTISSIFVQLAVVILPMLGIQVGSDALTNAIQTIVVIGTGLYIWVARVRKGDVSIFGARKTSYTKY